MFSIDVLCYFCFGACGVWPQNALLKVSNLCKEVLLFHNKTQICRRTAATHGNAKWFLKLRLVSLSSMLAFMHTLSEVDFLMCCMSLARPIQRRSSGLKYAPYAGIDPCFEERFWFQPLLCIMWFPSTQRYTLHLGSISPSPTNHQILNTASTEEPFPSDTSKIKRKEKYIKQNIGGKKMLWECLPASCTRPYLGSPPEMHCGSMGYCWLISSRSFSVYFISTHFLKGKRSLMHIFSPP